MPPPQAQNQGNGGRARSNSTARRSRSRSVARNEGSGNARGRDGSVAPELPNSNNYRTNGQQMNLMRDYQGDRLFQEESNQVFSNFRQGANWNSGGQSWEGQGYQDQNLTNQMNGLNYPQGIRPIPTPAPAQQQPQPQQYPRQGPVNGLPMMPARQNGRNRGQHQPRHQRNQYQAQPAVQAPPQNTRGGRGQRGRRGRY